MTSEQKPEQQFKKLMRSLSQVSQVETRQIRLRAMREERKKRQDRIKQDSLLHQRVVALPNLMSYKLFESKDKKIESMKERYIESESYLRRANFQYKKIEHRRQEVARKQHKSQLNNYSPLVQREKMMLVSQPLLQVSKAFGRETSGIDDQNTRIIQRIKTTVNQSRKQVKDLYKSHVKHANQRHQHFQKADSEQNISASEINHQAFIKPTNSIILSKKKNILSELIRASSLRIEDDQTTKITKKQKIDHIITENTMKEMETTIEHNNQLKESIVLANLKKILYGHRRGRFIQDSTFKTRVKGQFSSQYMKIVKHQQSILNSFKGSENNRRFLVQKFSTILGHLRQQGKYQPQSHVSDLN